MFIKRAGNSVNQCSSSPNISYFPCPHQSSHGQYIHTLYSESLFGGRWLGRIWASIRPFPYTVNLSYIYMIYICLCSYKPMVKGFLAMNLASLTQPLSLFYRCSFITTILLVFFYLPQWGDNRCLVKLEKIS